MCAWQRFACPCTALTCITSTAHRDLALAPPPPPITSASARIETDRTSRAAHDLGLMGNSIAGKGEHFM